MKYDQIKGLSLEQVRRLTGAKRQTFERMVEILKQADRQKKFKGGRNNKLGIEDHLLMGLKSLGGIPHLLSYCTKLRD